MTIRILSAGRSGTGWLSTFLSALGYRVDHEWYGNGGLVHVNADTSAVWDDNFVNSLTLADDYILVVRSEAEITKSVQTLLGIPLERIETVLERFRGVRASLLAKQAEVGLNVHTINYSDMWKQGFPEQLRNILSTCHIPYTDLEAIKELHQVFKHMKIENKTAIEGAKASWTVQPPESFNGQS